MFQRRHEFFDGINAAGVQFKAVVGSLVGMGEAFERKGPYAKAEF